MRSIALLYILSMLLVGAIAAVAVYWTHESHVRGVRQGRVLMSLTARHGIHPFDLVILAVELVLLALLSAVLLVGFSRRR